MPYSAKEILSPQITKVYRDGTDALILESYDGRWSKVSILSLPRHDYASMSARKLKDGYVLTERDFKASAFEQYTPLVFCPLSSMYLIKEAWGTFIFREGVIDGQKLVLADGAKGNETLRVFFVRQKHKRELKVGIPVVYPGVMEGDNDIDMAPLF